MIHKITSLVLIFVLLHINIEYSYATVSAGQCSNGITQDQIDKLYSLGVNESKIEEICADSSIDPVKLDMMLSSGLPESILRRLIENNDVGNLTNNWPSIMASFIATGQLPPGVTPYYPEERDALKMIGLTDADLQYLPPANIEEKATEWAKSNVSEALDDSILMSTGLAITYLNLVVLAILSPFLLFNCRHLPSVLWYVGSSGVYLAAEALLTILYFKAEEETREVIKGGKEASEDMPSALDDAQTETEGYIDEVGNWAGDNASDVAEDCQESAASGGASVGTLEDCANAATPDVDDTNLKESWDNFANEAVDVVLLFKKIRDLMLTVRKILILKSIAAAALGGGWTYAAFLAYEENFIGIAGLCISQNNLKNESHKISFKEIFNTITSVLINEASAANIDFKKMVKQRMGKILGLGIGVALVGLTALVTSIVFAFLKFRNTGLARAILFGTGAALGFAASGLIIVGIVMFSGFIDKMNTIIAALEGALNNEGYDTSGEEGESVPSSDSGSGSGSGGGGGSNPGDDSEPELPEEGEDLDPVIPEGQSVDVPESLDNIGQYYFSSFSNNKYNVDEFFDLFIKKAEAATERITCFTGNARTINVDKSCDCLKSGSCHKNYLPKMKKSKLTSTRNIKNTINAANNLKGAANAIYTGNLDKYQFHANKIKDLQKSIQKEHRNFEKIVNRKLRKDKKRPINFANKREALRKQMGDKLINTINKFSPQDREKLKKGLQLGRPPANVQKMINKEQNKAKPVIEKLQAFFKGLGKYNRKFKVDRSKEKKKNELNYTSKGLFGKTASSSNYKDLESVQKVNTTIHDDSEVPDHDITKNENADIFKIISNRYLKTNFFIFE